MSDKNKGLFFKCIFFSLQIIKKTLNLIDKFWYLEECICKQKVEKKLR